VTDITELDWTAGTRDGDAIAWRSLVERYEDAVFRLAYLMLGNRQDAEDVAQDTFIRAYRNRSRFDTARPLRPWLLQICANLARNRRRSLGRYVRALRRQFAVQDPDDVVVAPGEAEAATRLWHAVRRLRSGDREVLYLRYFLDLTLAETACAAGIAEGTVKSRTARALERLRLLIADEFPELDREDDDER
jgi:RNA polymerase sigma-70 factor (ECF subfamily)